MNLKCLCKHNGWRNILAVITKCCGAEGNNNKNQRLITVPFFILKICTIFQYTWGYMLQR